MDSNPAQRGDSRADRPLPHDPQEQTPTNPADPAPPRQSAQPSVEPPKVVLQDEDNDALQGITSAPTDSVEEPARPVQKEAATQTPVTQRQPESSAEPANAPTPPESAKQVAPEPANGRQTSHSPVAEASASSSAVYETGESSSHVTQPPVAGATDDEDGGAPSFMDTSFGFSVRTNYP